MQTNMQSELRINLVQQWAGSCNDNDVVSSTLVTPLKFAFKVLSNKVRHLTTSSKYELPVILLE